MSVHARTLIETVHVGSIRYQFEQVRCGKAACRRCNDGPGHGPYWYVYERREGRLVRSYHGRAVPKPVEQQRRHDQAARLRARALDHDAVIDIVMALQDLGETLVDDDLLDLDDTCVEDLDPEQLAAVEQLADDMEQAADRLRDVSQTALRAIRRRAARHRRLIAEVESLLDAS